MSELIPCTRITLDLHDGGSGVDLHRLKRLKAVDTAIEGVRVEIVIDHESQMLFTRIALAEDRTYFINLADLVAETILAEGKRRGLVFKR